MNILDDLEKIKKIDKGNTLGSIEAMPEQLKAAWKEAKKIKADKDLCQAKNIVLAGMGGSALGGRVVKSLFEKELKIPVLINTEYQLPGFVNENSLVIVASYSGNTEETLSCLVEAKKRKARIFVYTTGGLLGELIIKGEISGLIFSPDRNPLGFPKTAIGYSIGLILGVFSRLGFISLNEKDFKKSLDEFRKIDLKESAKNIAKNLKGKIGIFIGSEHLKGAAYTFRNQINEIAHNYSDYYDLPEMNHHLVEGFASPKEVKKYFAYYFFNSQLYDKRVARRYRITKDILDKLGVANFEYKMKTKAALAQTFELVNLGGFVAFYLSILKNEDPGPEPWIIYFKKKLKEAAHEK